MSGEEVAIVLKELVVFCAPAAFLINMVALGCKVIIGACTGKGLVI